jgi:hypothetical protein
MQKPASWFESTCRTRDALRVELPIRNPGSAGYLLTPSGYRVVQAEYKNTPWWLWWNVLCLDAPTVAGLWALLFARESGVSVSLPSIAVLIVMVWVIYTTDRALDARKGAKRVALKDRHLFCAAHRISLTFLMVIGAAGSLCFASQYLRREELEAGGILGAVVVVYMICVHLGPRAILPRVPKELAVGALFAAGTTLPLWSNSFSLRWHAVLVWVLFAAVCALNCFAIECWENNRLKTRWELEPHPFLSWIDPRLSQIAACLVACLAMVWLSIPDRHYHGSLLAICVAALLTLLLNSARTRLSCRLLRVLADAALVIAAILGMAFQS